MRDTKLMPGELFRREHSGGVTSVVVLLSRDKPKDGEPCWTVAYFQESSQDESYFGAYTGQLYDDDILSLEHIGNIPALLGETP